MLLIALVVWSVEAGAITGEFDQAGDTQGWRARESLFSGSGSGSGSGCGCGCFSGSGSGSGSGA